MASRGDEAEQGMKRVARVGKIVSPGLSPLAKNGHEGTRKARGSVTAEPWIGACVLVTVTHPDGERLAASLNKAEAEALITQIQRATAKGLAFADRASGSVGRPSKSYTSEKRGKTRTLRGWADECGIKPANLRWYVIREGIDPALDRFLDERGNRLEKARVGKRKAT